MPLWRGATSTASCRFNKRSKTNKRTFIDPVERGVIRWEQLIEIGEILAGNKEGRTKAEQITFYKNNAGQGVADVALGAKVLEKIKAKNKGQKLELE